MNNSFFNQLSIINEEESLAQELTQANDAYRSGQPIMSDDEYDAQLEYLASLNSENPIITTVEPESLKQNTYIHTIPMLSTQKVYDSNGVNKWLDKIEATALSLGFSDPIIRCTAKLDGVACKYLPIPLLSTRGDGTTGNVITKLLNLGLKIVGDASQESVGEIVIKTEYFSKNLSNKYSHPRNFIAGVVNAESLSEEAIQALSDGAIELVLYKDMISIEMELSHFRKEYNDIEIALRKSLYPIDGVVYEAKSPKIKEVMGGNNHHWNWQLAKKCRANGQETTVTNITYGVGRTGQITPIIHISPVDLDGALTQKVTGHHVGNIVRNKIGIGSKVKVLRAGEVIPFLSQVVTTSTHSKIPTICPQCLGTLEMREDNLYCISDDCVGKAEAKIIHHFNIINVQLFGKVTVSKIVSAGFYSIESIYKMTKEDYLACGLGSGQAQNLLNEIERVKSEPLADYLLLGSLGIHKLGRGSSKRLLSVYRINELNSLTTEKLEAIDGFGNMTAQSICDSLKHNCTLNFLLNQSFIISHTQDTNSPIPSSDSLLFGKRVVFTGKCSVDRSELAATASSSGCIVQDRVTKETDFLVCGENVGNSKMESAKKNGANVITESEFRAMLVLDSSEPELISENHKPTVLTDPKLLAISNVGVTFNTNPTDTKEAQMSSAKKETSTIDTLTGWDLIYLDPKTLLDPEWGNPRTSLSDSRYESLKNSIHARKMRGEPPIHTPVFVRPVEGGVELVAGFTRRKAAIELELNSIPCLSRPMTDQQAYELAASENIDRTNMSALDEAKSFKEIVRLHNGDINAAATEMGWSKAKFHRAMQLLRASDKVRSLIGVPQENGFKLSVAHAAQLSVLPESLQNKILDTVIKEKMPVSVLADKIAKAVKRPLNSAEFDKSECESCPYNSLSVGQTSMFSEDNEDANCSNPTCYLKKVEHQRELTLIELEKEYGKVVLLSTVDNPVEIGSELVGNVQYTQGCLSCANHCAIYADSGSVTGTILTNRCIDSSCAQEKAAEHKATQTQSHPQPNIESDSSSTDLSVKQLKQRKSQPKATSTAVAATPKRLVMESQTSLRGVGIDLLQQHPSYALAVTLSSVVAQTELGHNVENGIIEYMQYDPSELQAKLLSAINKLTIEVQKDSLNMERTIIRAAKSHCDRFEDMAISAWKPTKERLTDMTKMIRQQVLEQSGFADAYRAVKSEANYNALLNKKSDLAVEEILSFDFDWTHFAPDYYVKAIDEQKYNF